MSLYVVYCQEAELPAYISSAATLLYAFFTLHRNKHDVKVEPHGSAARPYRWLSMAFMSCSPVHDALTQASHDSPTFLAKVENVSSKSELS